MKLVVYLLSFYLLLLPLVPCGDNDECNEDAKQELTTSSNHKNHPEDDEACTPFCYCSCCPASVFIPQFLSEPVVVSNLAVTNPSFPISLYSFDFSAIWQPPKIG